MSSTTNFDDTYLQRLQRDCLQGMEAVRNLDETSDPEDIRILVAISEQFASNSSLEQAVEQELSLPVIGTVLEQMQRRLLIAKSHSAEPETGRLGHALSQLDSLESDWMAHVEACRNGIDDRDEWSVKSLWTQMEPLQATFRPHLSLGGMPDAEAVVTLMKNSRPSMAQIIEDLHINSVFAIPDGCPPLEWKRLRLAIQTLRKFSDKY
ncbi:hypothetical protein EHS25_008289 [Saitozyma podzolica]|uniref:Uncharacterized protein n=1 Tax=Saitozyma podzolica TaxID=1890683 RepID=A0A427YP26_9TREE|nr:hypothetical protein EHS25_008289 [Saitozyma podzolica]